MSILLSFVPLLIMIAVVVLVIRKVSKRATSSSNTAQPVRLFFQYALAFGLFMIVTVGLAGLLSRALDVSNIVNADQSSLASNLAFVVVGGPLLAGITIWLRNSLRENPSEGHGLIPTFFATLAAIVSLLLFLSSAIAALHNVISGDEVLGSTLGRTIVWGTALILVLKISNSVIPKNDFRIQYFVGSFITALAALIGLVQVLGGVLALLLSQQTFFDTQKLALVSPDNPIGIGLGTLLMSGALWVYYWIKNANTNKSDTLWLAYVLIAGVGGTLVIAITSLSISHWGCCSRSPAAFRPRPCAPCCRIRPAPKRSSTASASAREACANGSSGSWSCVARRATWLNCGPIPSSRPVPTPMTGAGS